MLKFVKTLNSLDVDKIRDEVSNQKKTKDSPTLNAELKKAYPKITRGHSVRFLLNVWTSVVDKLVKPRYDNISQARIRLFQSLDRVMKALFSNEDSLEVTLVEFRKPIKDKFGVDSETYTQSIYNIGLTQAQRLARKQKYADEVSERNKTRGSLPPIYVEDILTLIHFLAGVERNVYEQSLTVLLATGSRSVELYKISSYSEIADEPGKVLVTGLAKNKSPSISLVRRLVGMCGRDVVSLVDNIRRKLRVGGKSNANITGITNQHLNKVFRTYIQPLAPSYPMTSHKCRYISGNISYLLYGEPEGLPYESYLQSQYGHLNPTSTKSYLAINIQFRGSYLDDIFTHYGIPLPRSDGEETNMQSKIITQHSVITSIEGGSVDLDKYIHPRASRNDKINHVISCLTELKKNNIHIGQVNLRNKLRYGIHVVSDAYRLARERCII